MKKVAILALGMVISFAAIHQAQAITVEEQTVVYESYAFEKKADYNNAIDRMVKVLKNNPNDYFVHYRLGWLFSLAKKYKNAAEHYDLAAQAASDSVEALNSLSLLYFNLGDFAQAISTCEKLLKRDPSHYYGLQRLISASIRTKQFGPALSKAETAVKLFPTDLVFLEQKGYIQMQLGKTADAKQTLQFLLLLSPTNAYAHSVLAGK